MGFRPTGEESPVAEEGELWSKGHELVCDKTGTVIDGNHHAKYDDEDDDREWHCGELVIRYRNSERVRMPGGYVGNYDWGKSGDKFRY